MVDHDTDTERTHSHGGGSDDGLERYDDPSQYRYLSAEELRRYLSPDPDWTVVDLGSGTGFYTDEIAPVVEEIYAVDTDEEKQDHYRAKGCPENVEPVVADVASLPVDNDSVDGAVSIRTFHHGVAEALDEVCRLLRPGGRFVVVDWSATGDGERNRGPPIGDCFDLATVQSRLLDAGFEIRGAYDRRETFVVIGQYYG